MHPHSYTGTRAYSTLLSLPLFLPTNDQRLHLTHAAMFRKKKNLGTVTVFDDEPDNFNDLGLSTASAPNAVQKDQPFDQMSTQQLEALALGSAQAGKEATSRALRTAQEAREIGVNTAGAMKKQTEQLEKMSEDIEVVHDYLDKSERKFYFPPCC